MQYDLSTADCKYYYDNYVYIYIYIHAFLLGLLDSHIIMWVQFENKKFESKRLFNFPSLPDLNGTTFFRVNMKNFVASSLKSYFVLI